MRFGGWARFGGALKFGGKECRGLSYYRLLKSLRPPGVYPDDDATLSSTLTSADGHGVGDHGQIILEALARNSFPQLAEESLPEWEALLRVQPPPGATMAQRREALLSRWRGGAGPTADDLRGLLVDLLAPRYAFRDTFVGEGEFSWRWLIEESTGHLLINATPPLAMFTITVGSAAHWEDGDADAVRISVPLASLDDSVAVDALIWARGSDDDTGGGIALYESDSDGWLFTLAHESGADVLRVDRIEDGVQTTLETEASGGAPVWLRIARDGEDVSFLWGYQRTDLEAGEHIVTTDTVSGMRPRRAGAILRNSVSNAAATMSLSEFSVRHGASRNNVQLVSMPLDLVPATSPDQAFRAFVRSDPDDAAPNLREAQRVCDRAKHAHVLILVGETDNALCDDEHSLTDRDVLGV